MSALSVGSTLAGCRLEAIAGRGGMGVVYRATQLALHRPVAVKVIAPHYAEDPSFRERFERESELAASIDHPNVIPVYEAGEREGVLYLIMRWVEGTELRALLRAEGRLGPERAVAILRPVASALAAAHRRGLVHRDVKPANVLLARGDGEEEHVYLTDFGIARRVDTEAGMTRTGALVGTLDYVAPERIEGGRGDESADIYSLGCMAYETLTGGVPFDRPNELAKMHAHVHDGPPSVRDVVPEVSARLDAVVARAMAKDPADRFPTAAEMARALTEALDVRTVDAARTARADADTEETTLPGAEAAPPTQSLPAAEPAPPTQSLPAAEAAPPTEPLPPGGSAPVPRGRSPWPAVLALGVVVAVIAVVVVLLSGGGAENEPGSGEPTSSTSTPATPPPTPTASGQARVDDSATLVVPGGRPGGITFAAGRVWAGVSSTERLVGLARGRAPVSVDLGTRPAAVAADPRGRIWVARAGGASVYDPAARRTVRVAAGTGTPSELAMTKTAAWLASPNARAVTRVALDTLAPRRIAVPAAPTALVSAYGRVWIGSADGRVRVLGADGSPDPVAGPAVPGRVVAGTLSRGVWLLSARGTGASALTRIDPRREVADGAGGRLAYHEPEGAPAVAGAPGDLAGGAHTIWVAAGARVTRLSTDGPGTRTGAVTFPAAVGALAGGDGAIWAAVPGADRVYRIEP